MCSWTHRRLQRVGVLLVVGVFAACGDVAPDTPAAGGDAGGDGDAGAAPDASAVDAPTADVDVEVPGPPLRTVVFAGGDVACSLSVVGDLRCWGGGQAEPTIVAAGVRFSDVAIGQARTLVSDSRPVCAIRATDGALVCWESVAPVPTVIDARAFTEVSIGRQHQCARTTTGAVYCWAAEGAAAATVSPKQVAGTDWKHVSAGGTWMCGVKTDDELYCWTKSTSTGELVLGAPTPMAKGTKWREVQTLATSDAWFGMYGILGVRNDGALLTVDYEYGPGDPGPLLTSLRVLDAGIWSRLRVADQLCGIKANGTLLCWGDNTFGQLGTGTQVVRKSSAKLGSPIRVGNDHDWVDIAVGSNFSCGAKQNGTLRCWGYNGRGALGNGILGDKDPSQLVPKKVGTGWSDVSVGAAAACAIRKTGANLACWGASEKLTMGVYQHTPAALGIGTTWSSVSVASEHACARKSDDSVHCWGENQTEQTGVTAGIQAFVIDAPTPVGLKAQKVAVEGRHSCALSGTGLYCWGDNYNRQSVPSASWSHLAQPVKVSEHAWSSFGIGNYATCGIQTNGTLWCFGDRSPFGGVGYPFPLEPVSADTTWTVADGSSALSSGPMYAIKEGTIYRISSPADTLPIAGSTYRAMSASGTNWCALRTDNTLWCAGANSHGEVGDGTTAARSEPVQVGSATDWEQVSVGGWTTCGLRNGGDLYCWGSNIRGQVGDGTAWSNVPVLVK